MSTSSLSVAASGVIKYDELVSLPVTGFILWTVQTQRWTLGDFRRHYGRDFPIEHYADLLCRHKLLNVAGPYLSPTKKGERLVANLVGEKATLDGGLTRTSPPSTDASSLLRKRGTLKQDMSRRSDGFDWTYSLPDPRDSPWNLNELVMPDYFIGRQAELDWLLRKLTHTRAPICGLYGMDGIGKTSLAAVAARVLIADQSFADGIAAIWCDHSQTQDQPLTQRDILRHALALLDPHGISPAPEDFRGMSAFARERLQDKDVLVILDHLDLGLRLSDPQWQIDELISALHSAGAALLLISDRKFPERIVPSGGSQQLQIDPLPEHEAVTLFTTELTQNDKRLLRPFEHEATLKIVHALGNHTLSIKLIGRLAARNRASLGMLADDLVYNPRPLHQLQPEARSYPGAFSPTTLQETLLEETFEGNLLTILSRESRQLFAAFAAFATVEFSRNAALRVGDAVGLDRRTNRNDPREAINALIRQAFVNADSIDQIPEECDRERLRLHTLLEDVAKQEFARWQEQKQQQVRRVIAQYYANYVLRLKQASLEAPLYFDKGNIVGAIEWAHECHEDGLVHALCSGMRAFWYNRWYMRECERCLLWGIEAGERLLTQSESKELLQATADLEFTQAQVLRRLGKIDDAEQRLKDNLRRRRNLRDPKGIAATLDELAIIVRIKGNLDSATDYIDQSLKLRREINDRQGEGHGLSQLARIKIWQGELGKAQEFLNQSLALAREAGDRRTEADDLIYLGQVARARGFLETAESHLEEARMIMHEIGDQRGEAVAYHQLGQVWRVRGDLSRARQYFLESLAIRRSIGDRRGEGEALGSLGRIARAQGHWDEAKDLFNLSLAIAREVGDRRGEGIVRSQLGRVAWRRGDLDLAVDHFKQSLAIREEVHDARGRGADLGYLGRIALQRGHFSEARVRLQESLTIARDVEDREGECYVLVALGMLKAMDGDIHEARRLLHQALGIVTRIQAEHHKALVRWELGRFYADFADKPVYGRRLMRLASRQLDQLGLRGEDIQGHDLFQEAAASPGI